MVAGTEFGSEAGNNMLVIKDLYGLKNYGAAFSFFLAETLDTVGYRPSYADPDLWLWPAVKPDGFEYFEYIFFYVNDVLCISHNRRKLMKSIQEDFNIKEDKIDTGTVIVSKDCTSTNWSDIFTKTMASPKRE